MPAQPAAEAADAAHHGTAENCQHHSYAQAGEPQPRPQQELFVRSGALLAASAAVNSAFNSEGM